MRPGIIALAFATMAAGAAPAQPTRPGPAPGQARADNCSIAIVGNPSNNNISTFCPIIQILQEVRDITDTENVDPLVLHLIQQTSFDEAVERIERLVADRVAKPSVYLSIAAAVRMAEGSPQEGLEYARRAYEADPKDAMLVLRYAASLTVNGRKAEAASAISSAYSRRSEFTGVGRHLLDVAKLENDYPFEALDQWRQAVDVCLESKRAGCSLDAAAQQSVSALRDRAARLEQAIAASEPVARLSMQTRHYLLQYVLISDELLRDAARASKIEAMMDELAKQILRRFGPWALLLSLQSEYRLDLVTPPARLRRKYQMFDVALEVAPASPIIALGRDTADEAVLPKQTGIMLASFRFSRAIAANRMGDNALAWRTLRAAIQDVTRVGNTGPAVQLRLAILYLAVGLVGSDDPNFDRSFVASEFRRLKAAFIQNTALERTSGEMLRGVSASLCESDVLEDNECADD